jgi:hypothetical protein
MQIPALLSVVFGSLVVTTISCVTCTFYMPDTLPQTRKQQQQQLPQRWWFLVQI